MINKRILIKNLLAYHSENSFFDKKQELNLHLTEGKAKFLKHICALSNSNPYNKSYIIAGVTDVENELLGVDFFDDSHLQNLVNAYLINPPNIQYDNVAFAHLPPEKVLGLVTIFPKKGKCYFSKKCHTIPAFTAFSRIGSISHPKYIVPENQNQRIVEAIEKASVTNLKTTLDNLVNFIEKKHADMKTQYAVFQECYTVCWSGIEKNKNGKTYLSRVDIELINENIKIFYSAFDEVEISYNDHEFTIVEYIHLGYNNEWKYYPFSIQKIHFAENLSYHIQHNIIFEKPQLDKKFLKNQYILAENIFEKLNKNIPLNTIENQYLPTLCPTLLLCYLSHIGQAKKLLITHKLLLKNHPNPKLYLSFKNVMRIMRKLKYEVNEV